MRYGHLYGEFTPNGDGTHSAGCRRKGCNRTGTMDCLRLAHTVEQKSVTVCALCGETDAGVTLALIEGAEIQPVSGELPRGKQILRFGALTDEVGLLSVVVEFIGAPQPLEGDVQFSLPTSLPIEKVQTEIPLAPEDGRLRFTVNLTPEGSESPAPAALIPVIISRKGGY